MSTYPELNAFFDRWSRGVLVGMGSVPLESFYVDQAQFRRSGRFATAAEIARYFSAIPAQGGSFDIDWSHSEWSTEAIGSPDVSLACTQAVGAEGDIVKVRAWARELAPNRNANSGGEIPCPQLVGRYLFRLRRVGGSFRICHETWSLRDGVCASCPAARACRSMAP